MGSLFIGNSLMVVASVIKTRLIWQAVKF